MEREITSWVICPIVLAGVLLMVGCAAPRRVDGSLAYDRAELIFHPVQTPLAPVEPMRPDWPDVVAYDRPNEETVYQETIVDRQDRYGSGRDDRYLRRFESIRSGVIRR